MEKKGFQKLHLRDVRSDRQVDSNGLETPQMRQNNFERHRISQHGVLAGLAIYHMDEGNPLGGLEQRH